MTATKQLEMIAKVQYTDLKGTAAADIFNLLALKKLGETYGLNTSRYEPVGLSIDGVEQIDVAFLCRDLQKDATEDGRLLRVYINEEGLKLADFLERLQVVLINRFDSLPPNSKDFKDVNLDELD